MTDPWMVLLGLAVIAFVFVLAPVAGSVYLQFRRARWLRCPETGQQAAIDVDATRAARSALFSRPLLRVRDCTLWPGRAGCAERCLPEVSADAEHP